jgi:DNA-binding LacI/PurR family transcriptional regulator
MSRVSLSAVAESVGVSAKTVSNVVNGTGRVGSEVRQRVEAAIVELGYRPNLAARHLRHGRSGLLALALPDLKEPYFAELASYFVSAAQERGRTVLVAQTGGDHATERALCTGEDLPSIDALVMSPLSLTLADLSNREHAPPLVLLGEQAEAILSAEVLHIGMENVPASRAAVEYLISTGRRRIAAIGVQSAGPKASSELRFRGYREALEAAGINVDPTLLGEVRGFTRVDGMLAVESLLHAGAQFDAVFCFNDSLAVGAVHALDARRISIPGQVAVMGFDDVDEAKYMVPPLTTIGPSPATVSAEAFAAIDRLHDHPTGRHQIPFELVIRESA